MFLNIPEIQGWPPAIQIDHFDGETPVLSSPAKSDLTPCLGHAAASLLSIEERKNHLRFAQIGLLRQSLTRAENALHGHCTGDLADLQAQNMKLGGEEIMLAADFDAYARAAEDFVDASGAMDNARQALDHEINCIAHMIRLNPKLKECVHGLMQSPNGLDRALAQMLANVVQGLNEHAPSAPANPKPLPSHPGADSEAQPGWLSRVALKLSCLFDRSRQGQRPSATAPEVSSSINQADQPAETSDLSQRIAIAAEANRRLYTRACKTAISTYQKTKEAAEASETVWEVVAIQSANQSREIDMSIAVALTALKEVLTHAPMGLELDWVGSVVENVENLESAKHEVEAERIGVSDKLNHARLVSSRAAAPAMRAVASREPMGDFLMSSVSQSSPAAAFSR